MKRNISIQLKAALLLVIFGLNTVVGFACAVGVDMGFNTTHHGDEEATEVHVHGNGEKHEHNKKSANNHHEENNTEKKETDGCCNDKVVKIYQTDKAVPQAAKLLNPVLFTAFVAVYYDLSTAYFSQIFTSTRYFVRGHHPPIPDIRIAIQSFQI